MTTDITGTLRMVAAITDALTAPPAISSAVDAVDKTETWTITAGNGAGQANTIFRNTASVTLNTAVILDLAGSLLSAFGVTLTFASVKGFLFINKSTADPITLKFGESNGWNTMCTGNIIVQPGGSVLIMTKLHATGYAVTAGTVEKLTLDATGSAADVDYDIIIIGDA